MTVEIDIYQLIAMTGGAVTVLLGTVMTVGRTLLAGFLRGLDERFAALEKARLMGASHWDHKFLSLERMIQDEAQEWQRLERELLTMKADLPTNYVRREDHIRGQAVIEAKLDGLAMRYENLLLKGDKHG
jgi:hypothetical protein